MAFSFWLNDPDYAANSNTQLDPRAESDCQSWPIEKPNKHAFVTALLLIWAVSPTRCQRHNWLWLTTTAAWFIAPIEPNLTELMLDESSATMGWSPWEPTQEVSASKKNEWSNQHVLEVLSLDFEPVIWSNQTKRYKELAPLVSVCSSVFCTMITLGERVEVAVSLLCSSVFKV